MWKIINHVEQRGQALHTGDKDTGKIKQSLADWVGFLKGGISMWKGQMDSSCNDLFYWDISGQVYTSNSYVTYAIFYSAVRVYPHRFLS